jgi:hypothetical protein
MKKHQQSSGRGDAAVKPSGGAEISAVSAAEPASAATAAGDTAAATETSVCVPDTVWSIGKGVHA